MKFEAEEPPCALSPGAKPHSVEPLVLLGLTQEVDGAQRGPNPRVGSKDHPSAWEPKTLKRGTDTYTGNLILCYKIICITSNSFKGFFFPPCFIL